MGRNVPSGAAKDVSFGPARMFLGPVGTTPTTDVGYIAEGGIQYEVIQENAEIRQGNPSEIEFTFVKSQDVKMKLTSIEWDYFMLAQVLGAAVTSSDVSTDVLSWGGQPVITEVAIHIQHYMAQSGNTLNVYGWRMAPDGGFSHQFGNDPHSREHNFKACRASTNWAGATLAVGEELIKVVRQK